MRDWWRASIISILGEKTFCARLIPLNKVWPDIPKEDQFRPIVVVSPVIKWLETRFLQQIKLYMFTNLDKQQTGFVNGCGTGLNIQLLLEKMRSYKKRDGKCVVFIDFKSAYNTIQRDLLWDIMKRRNIMSDNDIQFLKTLHDKIYFVANGERFYFKNGVGQGLTTSPGLFNIYMEEVMSEIKEALSFELFYLLYADDLVCIADYT